MKIPITGGDGGLGGELCQQRGRNRRKVTREGWQEDESWFREKAFSSNVTPWPISVTEK